MMADSYIVTASFSSDSEVGPTRQSVKQQIDLDSSIGRPADTVVEKSDRNFFAKQLTDAEISVNFGRYYLKQVTSEFSEDLDCIRRADDFHGGAFDLLVTALQDGTVVFSTEDLRRIILSARSGQDT